MKRQVLEDLLKRHASAKLDGNTLKIPSETELSLYLGVGVGAEPLILDKISSLVLEDEAVVAVTRRKERYLIAYEDLRALRLSPEGATTPGI